MAKAVTIRRSRRSFIDAFMGSVRVKN